MQIPFLIEPAYDRSSVWCRQMREGIEAEAARKKHTVELLDGRGYRGIAYDAVLPQRRLLALVGTSPAWISETMEFLAQRQIEVILASYQPMDHAALRGIVQMDYPSATAMLLQYLRSCGKRKTALYGCSGASSTDEMKKSMFLRFLAAEGTPSADCVTFDNDHSLAACYEAFRARYRAFDSVICANDIAAASLILNLQRDGGKVPETLYVAAFGNSEIAAHFTPGITTATLNHEAVGRQLVLLYSFLYRNQTDAVVSVRVPSHLAVRQSTGGMKPDAQALLSQPGGPAGAGKDFYQDGEVQAFSRLETLLMQFDPFDWQILRGLMRGETYEALAERLDAPLTTVRYRIRRMVGEAGCGTKKEFEQFLQSNAFAAQIAPADR